MNQIIFILHVAVGAGLSVLIGRFFDISITGISYLEIAEACIGGAVGGFAGIKLLKEKALETKKTKMIWINLSLWFGVTAGLLAGVSLGYFCILPLFSLMFGHPETTKWSAAVANTFTVILLALSITCSAVAGSWFFSSSLRFATRSKDEKAA